MSASNTPAWGVPVPLTVPPDLPTFPVDALPTVLRRFVSGVATETQTETEIAGLLTQVAVSATLAGRYEVRVNDAWAEPCVLWCAALAAPGSRKSAVFSRVTGPLLKLEAEQVKAARPEAMRATSERNAADLALKKAERDLAAAHASGTDVEQARSDVDTLAGALAAHRDPPSPRLVVSDATPEAVSSILCETGGRLAVMSPESEPFALMLGRYGNGPNYDVFLKGHAGDPLQVDRKGAEPLMVPQATLCVALAVQPDVLAQIGQKHASVRGRGLPARFLYGMSPGRVGYRELDAPCTPTVDVDAYAALLRALLTLETRRDAEGYLMPRPILLAPAARAPFDAFRAEVEAAMRPEGALADLADWAGKLCGATLRIAAVLHAATVRGDPSASPIPADTMLGAIKIARWSIPHALAAFGLLGASGATDRRLPAARRVLRWLLKRAEPCSPVSEADVWRGLRNQCTQAECREAIALLVEYEHVEREPRAPRRGPGRPRSQRLLVNPWHGAHTQSTQPTEPDNRRSEATNHATRGEPPEE